MAHPGSGGPWEWRTLEVADPGSGGPSSNSEYSNKFELLWQEEPLAIETLIKILSKYSTVEQNSGECQSLLPDQNWSSLTEANDTVIHSRSCPASLEQAPASIARNI